MKAAKFDDFAATGIAAVQALKRHRICIDELPPAPDPRRAALWAIGA